MTTGSTITSRTIQKIKYCSIFINLLPVKLFFLSWPINKGIKNIYLGKISESMRHYPESFKIRYGQMKCCVKGSHLGCSYHKKKKKKMVNM